MKKTLALILTAFMAFSNLSAQMVDATVSLTGNVFNSITREPETVGIILYDKEGNKVGATRSNSAENGSYIISGLKPGKSYDLKLKRKSYMETKYSFTVPQTSEYKELSHDFLVIPLEKGGMVPIAVPPFEVNKSKLRVGADIALDYYASILSLPENKNVNFTIMCFADNDKSQKDNSELTDERATAIYQYLVSKGIDAARIKKEGSKRTSSIDPPKNAKESKGKRYIGKSYFRIDSF